MQADIAVIGGSGVYDTTMLDNVREVEIDTPFGNHLMLLQLGLLVNLMWHFFPDMGKGTGSHPVN